jgi:hypothetical protein
MARTPGRQKDPPPPPPPPPPPAPHQCGIRIDRAAVVGQRVGAGECAFVTYVYTPAAGAVTGVVGPPVGVYWGPGERVHPTLPSGSPVARYDFAGGVIFVNC